jgi:hypothetical protein
LSPWCQSRRMEKGGIVPPPVGLGPRDGARVVSPRSPVLRPGQDHRKARCGGRQAVLIIGASKRLGAVRKLEGNAQANKRDDQSGEC